MKQQTHIKAAILTASTTEAHASSLTPLHPFSQRCNVPGVISYYESYHYASEFWIVMELCEGGSLKQVHVPFIAVFRE